MITDTQNLDDYIKDSSMGRHETFTPRYGWLKKGYDATALDGNVFKAPDAIERLGVGKNMVRSIRFWCQAFKIIEADRTGFVKLTLFGDKLLDEKGWDLIQVEQYTVHISEWNAFNKGFC